MGKDDPAAWLMGLVLGAAQVLDEQHPDLVSMELIEGEKGVFEVFGKKTAEEKPQPLIDTGVYRLYVAKLPSGQLGFMKISVTPDDNSALEKEAMLLSEMQDTANRIDHEAGTPYNYGAFFPQVIEIMNAGDRVAVFLGFHESIRTYKQFSPLSLVTRGARVDLQTGVWLLGKQLKVLDFLHRQMSMALGRVEDSNILIEPDQHGVFFLDFTEAISVSREKEQLAEVSDAAEVVWRACGGTDTEDPPNDIEIMTPEQHAEFVAFLRRVMEAPQPAIREHEALYALANRIWPMVPNADGTGLKRQFHEFQTYAK